jgi:LuxR family maltose regulon positive regulatory protein
VEQNIRLAKSDPRRATTILLNAIAYRSDPVLLVLDDYQRILNECIHRALRWMLEQGPANLHLLVLSHHRPPRHSVY